MTNPLKIILLSTLFGLLSGVVGGLISSAYISPNQILVLGKNEEEIITENNNKAEGVFEVYKKISPTILDIYLKKPTSKDPLKQIYLEKDRVAVGVILTSDGWIAARGKTFAEPKNQYAIITSDKKILTPQKIIFDKTSGIYYLKTEAENLPVPELGNYEDLFWGEKIIIPTRKSSFKTVSLENLAYEKNDELKNLLKSSERDFKLISLGGNSEAIAEGTPLFGLRGELIGITNSGENTAIPTSFWQKNFFTLIKNEEIKRPYLGVHYLDLSSSPGMEKNFSQNKTAGALIWSDKALGIAGVIKNSPAEKAGLRDGDIILKINSEELTAKTNLADIVADYAPGIKIRLTISRNEEEKTVEAELTNSPISATLNR